MVVANCGLLPIAANVAQAEAHVHHAGAPILRGGSPLGQCKDNNSGTEAEPPPPAYIDAEAPAAYDSPP
jgi:hypothetical protein